MTQHTAGCGPPRYSRLELPRWSCLPSHIASADFERLRAATDGMAEKLDAETVAQERAFRYGADLFNAGFFWEAHEVWEPVWMALPPNSRARQGCQALIQAANACLKLRFGRAKAFGRLAAEVTRLAGDVTVKESSVAGVEFGAWERAFQTFTRDVAAGRVLDYGFAPRDVDGFPFVLLMSDDRP